MVAINELVKSINSGLSANARRIFEVSQLRAMKHSVYLRDKGVFVTRSKGGVITYPLSYTITGNFIQFVPPYRKRDGTFVKGYNKKTNFKSIKTDTTFLRESVKTGLAKLKYDIGDKLKQYGRVEIT